MYPDCAFTETGDLTLDGEDPKAIYKRLRRLGWFQIGLEEYNKLQPFLEKLGVIDQIRFFDLNSAHAEALFGYWIQSWIYRVTSEFKTFTKESATTRYLSITQMAIALQPAPLPTTVGYATAIQRRVAVIKELKTDYLLGGVEGVRDSVMVLCQERIVREREKQQKMLTCSPTA